MPRVPQYERQVESQLTPLAPQRATATAYNFGKGQADNMQREAQNLNQLSNALDKTGDVFLKMNEKKDKALVMDSFNQANSEVRQHMASLSSLKGKDGIDIYGKTEKTLNDIRRKYLDSIKDQGSKDLFSASYDQLMNDKLDKTMMLQLKNVDEYDKTTKVAMNENAIDEAVTNYKDPKVIADSEFVVEANTRSIYKGYDKETVDKYVKDGINDLHMSVAESIVSQSPSKALEYMDTHWDKLDPSTRDKKKAAVQDLAQNEIARNQALFLSKSGLPLEEQLKEVEKIQDPEQQKKTKKLVEDAEKDKQSFAELAQKQRYEVLVDEVMTDPYKANIPMDLPSELQVKLYDLQQKMKDDAMAAKGIGNKIQTDFTVWASLINMPEDKFLKVDLTAPEYKTTISTTDLKTLLDMQKNPKSFSKVQPLNTYVNDFVKNETSNKEKQTFLREMFENTLNNYPKEERNKIETYNKVKDQMLLSFDVKGSVFDSKQWEVQYSKRKGSDVVVIAPEDRPKDVPDNAVWTSTPVAGKTGWLYTNSKGVQFLRDASGDIFVVRD